jgi:hypothetical protein
MAYKYKLNELSSDVLSKIGTFIKNNPKVEYIRKEFVQTPANTDESEKCTFFEVEKCALLNNGNVSGRALNKRTQSEHLFQDI